MVCDTVTGSPESQLDRAVLAVIGGGCIVYPTETFYALGASVGSAKALERVNAIKGRPRSKPLPVIIGDRSQLAQVMDPDAATWPGYDSAMELMELFWPGSLSIIVPARKDLPTPLLDARGCVSVRQTPHPQARELCLKTGTPLAATSANVSGDPAVSELSRLSPAVCMGSDYVLKGDPRPAGGLASTVVRPRSGREVSVYRVGAVPLEALERAGFLVTLES